MYSRKKFQKAIELYLKYDKSVASVIRELGNPSYKTLPRWYTRYLKEQKTGIFRHARRSQYSMEQKKAAVEHYFEHGQCLSRTVRVLGYPSREQLGLWLDELAPDTRKSRVGGVRCTREQKESAVIALCIGEGSAGGIARDLGITRAALYNWKNSLLGKEARITMPKSENRSLPDNKEALLSEIDRLKRQIRELKLEKDILEGAVELIKKDPGIDLRNLANTEKTILVDALKNEYPLNALLGYLGMARSSYFYHRKITAFPDKYEELRRRIIELFHENRERYGYRRIHISLTREGRRVSEKVVRRIMSESDLVVVGKKKRNYSSYQEESHPAADNLIDRDFHAEAPNVKWLTDITEFAIPAGKVYLSPIVDCFDGLVTSWSIGTNPHAELVNTMLDRATMTLK